jgi:hypothetical protein
MPFAPIIVNTKTFLQSGDGRYMNDSVAFGDPADYFTVKGGSLNKDRRAITAAVSRVLEKDVTVGTGTERRQISVQLIIQSPTQGFTSTDVDDLASDISEFLDVTTLNRLLGGES